MDGTVTGNGSDHVFLVDFRLPVDATGWTWADSVINTQTIASGSTNWYITPFHFWQQRHPDLSQNPFATVTKTTSPTMGLSLAPMFIPPQAYVTEYNSQGGFWIEFEMGTTNSTSKHVNTAEFHFVLYKHNPAWGNRSAAAALLRVLPAVVRPPPLRQLVHRSGRGQPHRHADGFPLKYQEGTNWDDSYTQTNNILTMRYQEPWAMHITYTDPMVAENQAVDIAANDNVCGPCPNRGWQRDDQSHALLLSMVQQPDGYPVGGWTNPARGETRTPGAG